MVRQVVIIQQVPRSVISAFFCHNVLGRERALKGKYRLAVINGQLPMY